MTLFLDYLWIWFVLTAAAAGAGYVWFQNDPKGRTLTAALLLPVLTLSCGLLLYYGVDTDRKAVCRMLDALSTAIVNDDLNGIDRLLSPKAEETRKLAEDNMSKVDILQAKYHHLQIEVNDAASPPLANIRFNAVFYWKNKTPVEGFLLDQPIPEYVRFEVELVKTKDKQFPWHLTNKCRYFFRKF